MHSSRALFVGVALFLKLGFTYATAPLLTNYTQLVTALENADDVRAIIHFDRCQLTNEQNQARQTQIYRNFSQATTRFNFNQYLHATLEIDNRLEDTVSTTIKTYVPRTTNEIFFTISRLMIFDDNTATLHITYFDELKNKKLGDIEWLCTISNGRDTNGLYLYDFP